MTTFRTSVASGQPFNIPQNSEAASTAGQWTRIGAAAEGRAARIQGVYWSSTTPGARLQIRDAMGVTTTGIIWYDATCLGGEAVLDLFTQHLTLFTPFEYLDSEGGNTIVIYGEYV